MSFNTDFERAGHFGNDFLLMVAALFLLDLYTSWHRSTVFSWFFPCDFHACVTYVRCFRYEDQHPLAILMVNGGRGQSNPAISSSTFRSPCKELSGEAIMVVNATQNDTKKLRDLHSLNASCFFLQLKFVVGVGNISNFYIDSNVCTMGRSSRWPYIFAHAQLRPVCTPLHLTSLISSRYI